MAYGIAAGALLAFIRRGSGALGGIAAVGLDLLERGHREAARIIGFVLQFEPDVPIGSASPSGAAARARGPSMLISAALVGSGCVCSHSARAEAVGSTPAFCH